MLPLILAAAGSGLSAYGAIKSAQDQADADREKATSMRQQADEIAMREQWNDAIRAGQTFKSKLDFGAAAAGTGHAGTGIGSQLEIQRQGDLATALADRDATFQEAMLRKGADLADRGADQTETAGYINAAGSLLGSAGKMASSGAYTPNTGAPQSLPRPSFSGG